jgi:hypothetical protein
MNTILRILTCVLVTFCCLLGNFAWAQPKKGGGGGGGSNSKPYRLVPLSLEQGTAFGMNEAVSSGTMQTVELVGEVASLACHWQVTSTGTSQSINTTPLLSPAGFVPVSGRASDINNAGIIVGHGYAGDGIVRGLVWDGHLAEPITLPMPAGFTGFGVRLTNINNATNGSGIILGNIDGIVPDGSGGWQTALGIIVWRFSFDEHDNLIVSPPTWFSFSDQAQMKIGLNDAGWIVLTHNGRAHRYRLDWELVWDPLAGEGGDFVEMFYLADGEGDMHGANVTLSWAGGINQEGIATGYRRPTNSHAEELFGKRLDGTFLSFPVYASGRDLVTRIYGVRAINDVTTSHNVQVLGMAGSYSTRNGYRSPRPALWESGGTVRLLQDITVYPTDASYTFKILGTSMYDLNDASWICGQTQRQLNGQSTDIPSVLIRN